MKSKPGRPERPRKQAAPRSPAVQAASGARFVRSVGTLDELPRDGRPQIAFVGRSNVGKSSLINYLTNRKQLAKISKTPGKTRVLNFFAIGETHYYVDLPGYGYAEAAEPLERFWANVAIPYLSGSEGLSGVVWLLDVRREPSALDHDLWALLRTCGVPIAIAVTKCDKLSRNRQQASIAGIRKSLGIPSDVVTIPTSSADRTGKKALLSAIGAMLRRKRTPEGTA